MQMLDQRIEYAKRAVADEDARRGTTPGTPSIPLAAERTDPSQATEEDGTLARVMLHPGAGGDA